MSALAKLTYAAIRLCPACRIHFLSHGVACLRHTPDDQRSARALAIGSVEMGSDRKPHA